MYTNSPDILDKIGKAHIVWKRFFLQLFLLELCLRYALAPVLVCMSVRQTHTHTQTRAHTVAWTGYCGWIIHTVAVSTKQRIHLAYNTRITLRIAWRSVFAIGWSHSCVLVCIFCYTFVVYIDIVYNVGKNAIFIWSNFFPKHDMFENTASMEQQFECETHKHAPTTHTYTASHESDEQDEKQERDRERKRCLFPKSVEFTCLFW